ncbi:MAG: helix-turn-helix transcriptional regulator [Alsobacter sp.]
MKQDIVDLIYEASVIPEQWPDVLEALSRISGSSGTTLFVTDLHNVGRWTSSRDVRPHMEAWIREGWQSRTERTGRMLAHGHLGFIRDLDVFTPEEWDSEPSLRGFFRPRGFGWASGTFIPMPTGDNAVISVERLIEQGSMTQEELARLDALRGHIARASLISTRLRLEQARNTTELFAALGLPAAVIGPGGNVLAANALLENTPGIKSRAFGRLGYQSTRARGTQADPLASLADGQPRPRSVPLPGGPDAPPIVVHEVPITRSAHDVFAGGQKLIYLTPVTSEGAPPAHILSGLFDLTPGETRVAQRLASGRGVDEAAGDLGLSRETIRSHLKAILSKVGVRGRPELVALLTRAASGPSFTEPG